MAAISGTDGLENVASKPEVTWDLLRRNQDDPSSLTALERTALSEHELEVQARETRLEKANERLKRDCKLLISSGSEKSLIPA